MRKPTVELFIFCEYFGWISVIILSSIRNYSFIFINKKKLTLSKRTILQNKSLNRIPANYYPIGQIWWVCVCVCATHFLCVYLLNVLWNSFSFPLAYPEHWSTRNWIEFRKFETKKIKKLFRIEFSPWNTPLEWNWMNWMVKCVQTK